MIQKIVFTAIAVAAIAIYSAVPAQAIFATYTNPEFSQGSIYGRGPQQDNGTLGFQYKNDTPPYGYWGVGPDYGNYEWPYVGPYGERPRGRPMDALTYAPFPIQASGSSVRTHGDSVQVSYPGRGPNIRSVDFSILGEGGGVLTAASVLREPFGATIPLPEGAQQVRVTVNYCDGFSTSVFWIP